MTILLMEVRNVKHEARVDWLSWALVVVLYLLTGVTVASTYLTLELNSRLDAIVEAPAFRSRLPCAAIPTRLVLDHPECAQRLLEAMNVTNVRIEPRGSGRSKLDEGLEILRRVNEINRQNRQKLNVSRP